MKVFFVVRSQAPCLFDNQIEDIISSLIDKNFEGAYHFAYFLTYSWKNITKQILKCNHPIIC